MSNVLRLIYTAFTQPKAFLMFFAIPVVAAFLFIITLFSAQTFFGGFLGLSIVIGSTIFLEKKVNNSNMKG